MNLATSAARGGAVTLAGQLLRGVVQVAATAILARLLNVDDFAIFAMGFAFLGVAVTLGDFGLSMAAIQSRTITNRQRSNLFWTNLLLGLILYLIAYACSPLIAAFYNEPALVDVGRYMAIGFFIGALSAQFRAEITAQLRFKTLAIVDVVAAVIALIAGVAIAVVGLGYWALVAQQLTLSLVTLFGVAALARWFPGLPRRTAGMMPLYRFGINTLGQQVFVYASANIDSILLGRFSGPAALGYYDRAYSIFRIPLQQIANPLTRVGMPILSRLQGDKRYGSYAIRAQLVVTYAIGGMFLYMFAISSPMIDLWLGGGWAEVKPIFMLLAVGGVFQVLSWVYGWVFLSLGLTGLQFRWTVIGRSLVITGMVVGVQHGATGVAAGAACAHAINWLLHTFIPMRKTGVNVLNIFTTGVRPIALYLPAALAGALLTQYLIAEWDPWAQIVVVSAGVVAYIGLTCAFRKVRHDYSNLIDTARRLVRR